MDFAHYQEQAARTLVVHADKTSTMEALLGLLGESGEVANALKKHLFHGHPLDRAKLAEELGDVLWYCAAIATLHEMSLPLVAQGNINKLLRRYPDGFSEQASRDRTV